MSCRCMWYQCLCLERSLIAAEEAKAAEETAAKETAAGVGPLPLVRWPSIPLAHCISHMFMSAVYGCFVDDGGPCSG